MAEVTGNSFGKEEVQKGADTGLRPTQWARQGRDPEEASSPVVETVGTPGDLTLFSPLCETSEVHRWGQDRQDMTQSRQGSKEG